jgi:hypothetical protein
VVVVVVVATVVLSVLVLVVPLLVPLSLFRCVEVVAWPFVVIVVVLNVNRG